MPSKDLQREYAIAVNSMRQAFRDSLAPLFASPARWQRAGLVSIAPRVEADASGDFLRPVIAVGLWAGPGARVAPGLGHLLPPGVPAIGPDGAPLAEPAVLLRATPEAPVHRQAGERPITPGVTVSPARGPQYAYIGSGGTMGAFLELDGRVALLSCTHVLGDLEPGRTRPPGPAIGDPVLEPAGPYWSTVPQYGLSRSVAKLAWWTSLTDPIDAAVAWVLDPVERFASPCPEPAWCATAEGEPALWERVRLRCASGDREGIVLSLDAEVLDPTTGVILPRMIQYGRSLSGGGYAAITRNGDSGAVLLQGTGPVRAVGLHVAGGGALALDGTISSFSYAHRLTDVFRAMRRPPPRQCQGPAESSWTPPEQVRLWRGNSSPAWIEGPGAPDETQNQGGRMSNSVVINIHMSGGGGNGEDGVKVLPPGPSSTLAAVPRQAFGRFGRIRFGNGTLGRPTGGQVVAGGVTPGPVPPPPPPPPPPPAPVHSIVGSPAVPIPEEFATIVDVLPTGSPVFDNPNELWIDFTFVPNGGGPIVVPPKHVDYRGRASYIETFDAEVQPYVAGQPLLLNCHVVYVDLAGQIQFDTNVLL